METDVDKTVTQTKIDIVLQLFYDVKISSLSRTNKVILWFMIIILLIIVIVFVMVYNECRTNQKQTTNYKEYDNHQITISGTEWVNFWLIRRTFTINSKRKILLCNNDINGIKCQSNLMEVTNTTRSSLNVSCNDECLELMISVDSSFHVRETAVALTRDVIEFMKQNKNVIVTYRTPTNRLQGYYRYNGWETGFSCDQRLLLSYRLEFDDLITVNLESASSSLKVATILGYMYMIPFTLDVSCSFDARMTHLILMTLIDDPLSVIELPTTILSGVVLTKNVEECLSTLNILSFILPYVIIVFGMINGLTSRALN